MGVFARSSFTRSLVLPFALTVWLAACHKWVFESPSMVLPAQAGMPVEDRDQLRLHVSPDGTIEGTLMELTEDSVVIVDDETRHTAPLNDVTGVEVRRPDVPTSVALGIVITAAAVATVVGVVLIVCNSEDVDCS